MTIMIVIGGAFALLYLFIAVTGFRTRRATASESAVDAVLVAVSDGPAEVDSLDPAASMQAEAQKLVRVDPGSWGASDVMTLTDAGRSRMAKH